MTRLLRSGTRPRHPDADVDCAAATNSDGGAPTPMTTPDRVIGSWAASTGPPMQLVSFVVPGMLAVVAGGVLAAVIAPAPTEHATWAAAYLVLVWGVGQVGLGLGQGLCAGRLATALVVAQVIGWNLGSAAVVVGTVSGVPAVADVGAVLLVVTLILLARGVTGGPARRRVGVSSWARLSYGLLIMVLLVSIPVGLILLRLRA
jgi:hypothetical protein